MGMQRRKGGLGRGLEALIPRHEDHGRLEIEVDAIDEKMLVESIQKIANRITVGLLLAALIVGAAMLMRVETRYTIFGYPALAIVFFLAASVGAVALLFDILVNDEKRTRKERQEG